MKFDDELLAGELRELTRSDPRQLDIHDALWKRVMIRELLSRR